MKNCVLCKCLCLSAALAVSFSSCSFLEDPPVLSDSDNLACFSSIYIGKAGASSIFRSEISALDVFVYQTDSEGTLDSYEHFELTDSNGKAGNSAERNEEEREIRLDIASRAGEKNVVVIANMESSLISYKDILSRAKMAKLEASLYNEIADRQILTGECRITAGSETPQRICLRPLTARVRIRKFEVDFSSTGYADKSLDDVMAYLVNVNACCRYLQDEAPQATDFINFGSLDKSCMEAMSSPQMLLNESGDACSHPLYCYPRSDSDGGANPTMLVIEGKIDGLPYYYPFKIGGGRIERATDYVFDIKISRSGASVPYEEISVGESEAAAIITEWKEYDWENVDY